MANGRITPAGGVACEHYAGDEGLLNPGVGPGKGAQWTRGRRARERIGMGQRLESVHDRHELLDLPCTGKRALGLDAVGGVDPQQVARSREAENEPVAFDGHAVRRVRPAGCIAEEEAGEHHARLGLVEFELARLPDRRRPPVGADDQGGGDFLTFAVSRKRQARLGARCHSEVAHAAETVGVDDGHAADRWIGDTRLWDLEEHAAKRVVDLLVVLVLPLGKT